MRQVYTRLDQLRRAGRKGLAVLIDPDKVASTEALVRTTDLVRHSGADFVFAGGSLMVEDQFHAVMHSLRNAIDLPIVLFPGSVQQISKEADALLFLSLISGRNPELLIGQHVAAAPVLRKMQLEVVSCGYMLVDCGKPTTASYISQTLPLPYHKPEIAMATAMAGEMLGLKTLYLDGGSGAEKPISPEMIRAVRTHTDVPLIVGGGIREEAHLEAAYAAGADVVVVGTAFEEAPELLFAFNDVKKQFTR